MPDVPAHLQRVSHSYTIAYAEHEPRADDPHKADFEEWKRRRRATNTYYCDFAFEHRQGDYSECDLTKPLEAHHNIVELAMINNVDLTLLEKDFPGISSASIGAWIDSDKNLVLLCCVHHRAHQGIHSASYSDFVASEYIRHLIS